MYLLFIKCIVILLFRNIQLHEYDGRLELSFSSSLGYTLNFCLLTVKNTDVNHLV